MPADWSRAEVEATVANYLAMLELELQGIGYNKSDHRRRLQLTIQRSKTAIERKHQNISAILTGFGVPSIDGYKPLGNYQRLLYEVVADRLEHSPVIEILRREVDRSAAPPALDEMATLLEPPPRYSATSSDWVMDSEAPDERPRTPRFVDYLAREGRNASLGAAGEEFVLRFEVARLRKAGASRFADRVEHVSRTRGDGLGFDVLSYERDGRERLIEVKTTGFGRHTPFFVTRGELSCSREREGEYHLYRVFSFRQVPRVFALDGRLDRACLLDPVQWLARAS